ncbi:MAG: fumarate hydratase [Candidatus Syntrophosphaera sp.]|nr:fumarate hydratase [Candidatus Syntrophosphaera sp.]
MEPRRVMAQQIREAMISAIGEIYCRPHSETLELLKIARDQEQDEIARDMLDSILANAEIGAREGIPVCQDTGLVIVFAEIGTSVLIEGVTLRDIIEAAAAEAWQKYFLRDSIASDPLRRVQKPEPANTGSEGCNTGPETLYGPDTAKSIPVILHLDQVPGEKLTLHVALKGGGAENCSALKMFNPTTPLEDIEDFIVATVVQAGGKACPPVIVGVGIGGDFELCARLAKQALIVPHSAEGKKICLLNLEQRLLDRINAEGKGVQGFAGSTTALEVRILTAPCHIASLPVAVNLDCHAHRCTTRII